MAGRQYQNVSYGLNQPLNLENPSPVIAKRAPTTSDFAFPTTLWTNTSANTAYILTSVANNSASWLQLGAGGAGNFNSLTVTPGPTNITGTTNINVAGAGVTTIGTGGTGAVNIGNATGNTSVTGSLTASTGLTATAGGVTATAGNIDATAGNIVATAGNIIATAGNIQVSAAAAAFVLGNGIKIVAGTGDPNGVVTAPEGSLYLNTNGTGTANRAWINTNSGNVWTAITTAT